MADLCPYSDSPKCVDEAYVAFRGWVFLRFSLKIDFEAKKPGFQTWLKTWFRLTKSHPAPSQMLGWDCSASQMKALIQSFILVCF